MKVFIWLTHSSPVDYTMFENVTLTYVSNDMFVARQKGYKSIINRFPMQLILRIEEILDEPSS